MLSIKEKTALTKSRVRRKPRYVRIPVQDVSRVRVLTTNVNFVRVSERYERCVEVLQRLSADRPIYHLRIDSSAHREWFSTYCKLCDSFRSLNNSRPIRRMRITGFRMLNVDTRVGGYELRCDAYVSDLDCACVVLDSLARFMLRSGRITVLLHIKAANRMLSLLRGEILSHVNWDRSRWRLTIVRASHLDRDVLQLTVPIEEASTAINIAASLAGPRFASADFRFFGLRMDTELLTPEDLNQRYGSTDIGVMLSGNRYRCFQKFGQLTKNLTR